MNTAQAIECLRARLNISQPQLAQRLNAAVNTVWRWESGKCEPRRGAAFEKLAQLAAEVGLESVREYFETQRRLSIKTHVERLETPRSARRIPLNELEHLYGRLTQLEAELSNFQPASELMQVIQDLREQVALYLGIDSTIVPQK